MPCLIYKFVRLTTFRRDFKIEATLGHFPSLFYTPPPLPSTIFLFRSLSLAPRAMHTHISNVKFMFIFWLMFFLVALQKRTLKKLESKPLLSLTPAGAACGHPGCHDPPTG